MLLLVSLHLYRIHWHSQSSSILWLSVLDKDIACLLKSEDCDPIGLDQTAAKLSVTGYKSCGHSLFVLLSKNNSNTYVKDSTDKSYI